MHQWPRTQGEHSFPTAIMVVIFNAVCIQKSFFKIKTKWLVICPKTHQIIVYMCSDVWYQLNSGHDVMHQWTRTQGEHSFPTAIMVVIFNAVCIQKCFFKIKTKWLVICPKTHQIIVYMCSDVWYQLNSRHDVTLC